MNKQKTLKAVWIDEKIMIRLKKRIVTKMTIGKFVELLILNCLNENPKKQK